MLPFGILPTERKKHPQPQKIPNFRYCLVAMRCVFCVPCSTRQGATKCQRLCCPQKRRVRTRAAPYSLKFTPPFIFFPLVVYEYISPIFILYIVRIMLHRS